MNTDFDKHFRQVRRTTSIIIWLSIAVSTLFIVGFLITSYIFVSKVADQDWSKGLKPVIEKVWCGEPGCIGGDK